jgi:hypothetical protein
MPLWLRALWAATLVVGVLGFGAIGLCGGYVTASAIPELLQGHSAVAVMLIFSVPCVIAGIVMVKVCGSKIWHLLREFQSEEDPT